MLDDDALARGVRPPRRVRAARRRRRSSTPRSIPWLFDAHAGRVRPTLAQAAGGRSRRSHARPRCSRPTTSTSASFWVALRRPEHRSVRCSPGAAVPARPRAAGSCADAAPALGRARRRRRRGWRRPAAGAASATARDPDDPPLRGIRVLDFTTVWSGPYLTQLLADLGAEVIRVENPSRVPAHDEGLPARGPTPRCCSARLLSMLRPARAGRPDRPYNRHSMNNSIARNKLSCTLDPRRPEQRELLMRLVEQSDVFVENLKSSTLHQIGHPREPSSSTRNPRHARPAHPAGGTHRRLGALHRLRRAVRRPDRASPTSSGTTAASWSRPRRPRTWTPPPARPAVRRARRAALPRGRPGRGQLIELAQSENVMAQLGDVFVDCQLGEEPQRTGQPRPAARAAGCLPLHATTTAGWRSPSATTTHGRRSPGVIGRADLADDARFATVRRPPRRTTTSSTRAITAWTTHQDLTDARSTRCSARASPPRPQLDERDALRPTRTSPSAGGSGR